MRCPGLHCDGCGRGGGGAAALVVLVLIVIAAARRPLEHAARIGLDVLEVAAIVLGAVLGLAAVGAVAFVALRARRSRANRITGVSFPAPSIQRGSQPISARRRRAIEAPRPTLAEFERRTAGHDRKVIRQARNDD